MPNRMSVATISSPEFINITGISPFASKCEVKVLYLGQNRNRSYIDKEVATEMAQTLPGCPIVGYYSESKEDFMDHGDQVIIDGEGVKFKCLTVPYGFVAPDARIWFQDFEDTDEFGNKEIRTYLMTEGYLWTKQYQEAQKVINEGRPQSMELDSETLKGHWSTDSNRGIDFFIINDAIFSKLCILGEEVEPCFEGSSVTAPDVSSNFSKDDNFTKTLYTMIKELKELTFSLKEKGGQSMEQQDYVVMGDDPVVEPQSAVEEAPAEVAPEAPVEVVPEASVEEEEKILTEEDKVDSEDTAENQNNTEEFAKDSKEDKDDESESDDASDDETEDKEDDDEDKPKSKNTLEEDYALLQQEYNELQEKFTSLESENAELVEFKRQIEEKEKDELIASFYMLSDEDKKDVIENKAQYSLEDIEAKLSVICVRNKVNFTQEEEKKEEAPATIFNLEASEADSLPAWLKAVENRRNTQD